MLRACFCAFSSAGCAGEIPAVTAVIRAASTSDLSVLSDACASRRRTADWRSSADGDGEDEDDEDDDDGAEAEFSSIDGRDDDNDNNNDDDDDDDDDEAAEEAVPGTGAPGDITFALALALSPAAAFPILPAFRVLSRVSTSHAAI